MLEDSEKAIRDLERKTRDGLEAIERPIAAASVHVSEALIYLKDSCVALGL